VAIRTRRGHLLVGTLIGVLAITQQRLAIGEGSSKSNNSSDSKGSNDSSRSSGDSSKNSGASSERSGQSTENSPKNSTKGTSDESTNSRGGRAISIGLLVLVVGGLVVGGVLTTRSTSQQDQQRTQALVRFLQRNHALVVRDVATGEGPLLASWERSLGLASGERERLGRTLAGSPEQTELLQALDGRIDEDRARRFAAGFTRVARRSLGESRLKEITLAAGL
jgi:uncharacterized protein HemX